MTTMTIATPATTTSAPLLSSSVSYVTDDSSSEDDNGSEMDFEVTIVDRRVTFKETKNQVFHIPTALSCLEGDTEHHRLLLWYGKQQVKDFRRHYQQEQGSEVLTDVKQNRQAASFAVIDECDRQDELGICDPELIKAASQRHTFPSVYLAYAQALFDAQEVMQDLLEEVTSTAIATLTASQPEAASSKSTPGDSAVTSSSSSPIDQNALVGMMFVECSQEGTFIEEDPLKNSMMEWTAEAA